MQVLRLTDLNEAKSVSKGDYFEASIKSGEGFKSHKVDFETLKNLILEGIRLHDEHILSLLYPMLASQLCAYDYCWRANHPELTHITERSQVTETDIKSPYYNKMKKLRNEHSDEHNFIIENEPCKNDISNLYKMLSLEG